VPYTNLGLALVAPAMAASSLDLAVIADAQSDLWFVVWMPVAFLAYLVGVLGFALHGPLAAPVGDEMAGGVLAELSGPDLLVARAGRHALLGAGAAVAVPLFLGGGSGPWLPDPVWVAVKAIVLTALLSYAAGRLPRLRVPLLLGPAWVVLLPLVVLQDLVVGVVLL
jgi:NADH-quinone oxidoreductase subunit H